MSAITALTCPKYQSGNLRVTSPFRFSPKYCGINSVNPSWQTGTVIIYSSDIVRVLWFIWLGATLGVGKRLWEDFPKSSSPTSDIVYSWYPCQPSLQVTAHCCSCRNALFWFVVYFYCCWRCGIVRTIMLSQQCCFFITSSWILLPLESCNDNVYINAFPFTWITLYLHFFFFCCFKNYLIIYKPTTLISIQHSRTYCYLQLFRLWGNVAILLISMLAQVFIYIIWIHHEYIIGFIITYK